MTLTAPRPSGARIVAKRALAGLCGLGLLALQACATGNMPEPKYPIYMQDRPAEAVQTAAQAGDDMPSVMTPPVDDRPVVTPLGNSSAITAAELAPPPPPPPPTEDMTAAPAKTQAAAPASASYAPTAMPAPPPVTAPVRDTGAAYVYVLQAHDTLYGVSRRFGVPVKVLYDINALPQDATLRIGQKILLPATAADKGAEEHANGPGMTPLGGSQVAEARPVTIAPPSVKPAETKPAPAVAEAKPVVTAPPASKPAVVPVPPPATTVAVAKPPATTTTTTTKTTTTTPTASTGGFPSGTQISQMGRGMFTWPVRGKIIVPFGQLAPNVRNDGINISADNGADVVAAADGVVVYEGDQVKELGNTIYVKHAGGWYTGYSHLGAMKVKNNEPVSKGQVIGTVGQTGVIDRPQLHFEIRYTPSTDIAKPIDPNLVLP